MIITIFNKLEDENNIAACVQVGRGGKFDIPLLCL
jgi:hypothetical protein